MKQRVAWGPGPRASQAFMLAARARAIIQGRLAPSVDDVVALAGPILRHRMAVNFSARAEGITVETVISPDVRADGVARACSGPPFERSCTGAQGESCSLE